MSMSVPNYGSDVMPFPTIPHVVFRRDAWADDWVPVENLRCTRATWVAGPDVDQADFFHYWGDIKREDSTDFDTFEKLDLQDIYLQVRMGSMPPSAGSKKKNRDSSLTPVFTGIAVDDNTVHLGDSAGDSTIKAFGVAHILDRWYIDYGHVLEPDTGSGSVLKLGYCPKFNEKGQWGRALLGNRSSVENPEATGSQDYVFLHSNKPDAEIWNAKQVLEHIIGFSPYRDIMEVVLTGQVAALENIKAVWEPHGKSVMAFINEIISRKNGLTFSVDIGNNEGENGADQVRIDICTLSDEDVAVGDATFPANDRQQPFYFGTDWPTNHLVDPVTIRTTSVHAYNDIEVRGAHVKVCFSVSFGNNSLDAGWQTTLEQKYDAADGCSAPTNAQLADSVRSSERFRTVYRKFIIPRDFDWQVASGTAESDPKNEEDEPSNIAPVTHPDGTVTFDDSTPDDDEFKVHRFNSIYGKELYRDLPFLKGVDYSESEGDGPVNENDPDSNPEYRPMFAWVYNDQHSKVLGPPRSQLPTVGDPLLNWYYRLDGLTKDGAFAGRHGVHDGHVRSVDREMAFEVTCGPNHYLALGTFDDEQHPTQSYPCFDYTRIGATVFVESDAHLFIRKTFMQADELTKTLVVDVPDCEYWYAHPSTTVDIKEGALVLIHEENEVIRDDSEKLRSIAFLLFVWYGRLRRAMTVPIKQLGFFMPVGAFVWSLDFMASQPEVNTVVTGVTWEFDRQTTIIETGYIQLDGVGIVEGMAPGRSFSGRGGAATRGQGGKVGRGKRA